jgi:hypothetical protein
MDREFWRGVLADGARQLGRQLQSGGVDRTDRASIRALLVRAFDALDEDVFSVELVREVDASTRPQAVIPRPIRIEGPRLMGIVDGDFVDRLWAPERQVDLLIGRLQRFLDCIKREDVRRFLRTPTEGEGPEIDFEYTEG